MNKIVDIRKVKKNELKGKTIKSVDSKSYDSQVVIKFTDGTTLCVISNDVSASLEMQIY
jgi:hypothetical protein